MRLLEGRYLDRADPEKGRFRSFLLTSLKFFVADEEDRERAHKRGGGVLVPLEFSSGEERYQREPAHDETPERIFERRWALSVLDRVVERLRNEFVHHGRPEHFERLKVFLLGQSDAPVRRTGTRNEHLRGSAQGGHSQASQDGIATSFARKSRILSPIPRSGVRTPVSGGRADEEVAVGIRKLSPGASAPEACRHIVA